jgi:uncharacterized membrane-anchored protein YhcB (DUF1043 family)
MRRRNPVDTGPEWESVAIGLVVGVAVTGAIGYLLVKSSITTAQNALNTSLQSGINQGLASQSTDAS